MKQSQAALVVATRGPGLYDFTDAAAGFVAASATTTGLLTLFCRHTSASLLIQENADFSVRRDIVAYFDRLAPQSDIYEHDSEGPDDMPAHLKTALTQTHLAIPVVRGVMTLGAWQAVYLFEHRRAAHRREIIAHLIGQ